MCGFFLLVFSVQLQVLNNDTWGLERFLDGLGFTIAFDENENDSLQCNQLQCSIKCYFYLQ